MSTFGDPCPATCGKDNSVTCEKNVHHKSSHKRGNFEWLNEDRPREEQGWMCYEVAPNGQPA